MPALPLQGVRITDVCAYLAGPFAITLLAELGAEVIKIESIQRLDYLRMMGGFPTPDGYDWSVAFNGTNVNKYGVTLNLNHPKGRDIFKKLVEVSDVVAENFSPRVMDNWGLSYDELKRVNPKIIMLSMPGFGRTGPWRNYVTFGPNVEMLSGIPTISGYRDGQPMMNGYTSDPFASLMGAAAVMVALNCRQHTGKGQYIDLSQVEAVTSFMAGPIMDYTMNRRLQPRRGNRHAFMVPHGVYRCKGDDKWVTITVSSEEEWEHFCEVTGNPHWSQDNRFSDINTRYKNQDDLDKLIEDWTCKHDANEVMQLLQQAGVASTAVLTTSELLDSPHLREKGFFETVSHLKTGAQVYPGFPVKFSETPVSISMPAPTLGQHNEYILKNLLGMTNEQIKQLAKEEIIGTKPQGWPYSVQEEEEREKKFLVGDLGSGILKSMPKHEDNAVEEQQG